MFQGNLFALQTQQGKWRRFAHLKMQAASPTFFCGPCSAVWRRVLLSEPPWRVVAMPAPRMAAEQAVDREHKALDCAVLPKRLNRVGRARWVKAAGAPQVWGEHKLVQAHEPDQEQARKAGQEGKDTSHQRRKVVHATSKTAGLQTGSKCQLRVALSSNLPFPSMDDPLLDAVDFTDDGLIPAIVQDAETDQVLMMAYMTAETLQETLDTGRMVYWSRSRQERWVKGQTSGHTQTVEEVRLDCDGDTLLCRVHQEGGACHTGFHSCFHRRADEDEWAVDGEKVFDPDAVYE